MKFAAWVGGHAPSYLREAFHSWIDDGTQSETVAVGDTEAIKSIEAGRAEKLQPGAIFAWQHVRAVPQLKAAREWIEAGDVGTLT
jgi:hypothetical protein